MSLTVSRVQWLPPSLCMSACLIGSGCSREDLSLKPGAWRGPVRRDWAFPFRRVTWPALFVGYAILTCTIAPLVWAWDRQPDFADLHQIMGDVPGILAGAVLNAALEELIFRMLLLAVLVPAVGPAHAIALTGILFGLEHCGTAGLLGIALSTYTGWLFAKSMLETAGCRWALLQHTLGDIPVYAIVALGRV